MVDAYVIKAGVHWSMRDIRIAGVNAGKFAILSRMETSRCQMHVHEQAPRRSRMVLQLRSPHLLSACKEMPTDAASEMIAMSLSPLQSKQPSAVGIFH